MSGNGLAIDEYLTAVFTHLWLIQRVRGLGIQTREDVEESRKGRLRSCTQLLIGGVLCDLQQCGSDLPDFLNLVCC